MRKQAGALALIALGTAALAHTGVTNKDVMARMTVMKTIGDEVKAIGSMAKGERAFDADAANAALIEIAAQSAQITSMFEEPAMDPKSEALPDIWEQFGVFSEHAQETEAVAERLAGTVETRSDLGPVMGQISQACKACHEKFRH